MDSHSCDSTTAACSSSSASFKSLLVAIAAMSLVSHAALTQDRTYQIVRHGDVVIESIVEGDGPLIVLLPSLGRDSEELDPWAAEIARAGFRVIRPRPRGLGRSTGPMDKLTLHDLAGDVAAAISSQKAGPAIVAGHAFGHFVAKMVATDFPEHVRAVALVAAAQIGCSRISGLS